jgi:hypothetical protein
VHQTTQMLRNVGFHDVIAEDRSDQVLPLYMFAACMHILLITTILDDKPFSVLLISALCHVSVPQYSTEGAG